MGERRTIIQRRGAANEPTHGKSFRFIQIRRVLGAGQQVRRGEAELGGPHENPRSHGRQLSAGSWRSKRRSGTPVTNGAGSATSTVTQGQFGPSFLLIDGAHVAGIIPRSDGSGAYGGGTYDILGPTGTSLGFPTVAAKPGDTVEIFGVGFGPTNPLVPAGQAFLGMAAAANPVQLAIAGAALNPLFAGLSAAGIYQINVTIPTGLGSGDQPLAGIAGGTETQTRAVISLQ